MTIKNVREISHKIKSCFSAVRKTRAWKIFFLSEIDFTKIEERKREIQTKYGMFPF